jgi:predicted transcriptional regulator
MWIIIAIVIHTLRMKMKTVQMTIDDDLLKAVDRLSKQLRTNRSAFARKALRDALLRHKVKQLEDKQRQGYEQHPAAIDEFSVWETEQDWGD